MPLTIDEYLSQEGAMEILCEIDPDGSRFTDLDEALAISHTTLRKRLVEGIEVSLLDQQEPQTEEGAANLYMLSPKGATFRRALHESGTMVAHRQLKDARNQFNSKKEMMQEWARTELPKFNNEHHEGHLSLIQGGSDFYIVDEDLREYESQKTSSNNEE